MRGVCDAAGLSRRLGGQSMSNRTRTTFARATGLVLTAALALSLGACSKKTAEKPVPTATRPAASTPGSSAAPATTSAAGSAASGTREGVVFAALPEALKSAAEAAKEEGFKLPDVSGAKPSIKSIELVARTGKLDYLFEVFADGKVYELYAYPEKPNPASLTEAELSPEEVAVLEPPLGAKETAAAEAVKALMAKSPAGGTVDVLIYGYSIGFTGKDGKPVLFEGEPFLIEVDPKGKLVGV